MSSVSLHIEISVRFSCLIVLSAIKLLREVTLQLLCTVNKGESTLLRQHNSPSSSFLRLHILDSEQGTLRRFEATDI